MSCPLPKERSYILHYNDIYAVTPKGQQELRSAATTISPPELDLLVRLDGILSIAQIRQSVGEAAGATLDNTVQLLLAKGLVTQVQADPFAASLQFQLSPAAL